MPNRRVYFGCDNFVTMEQDGQWVMKLQDNLDVGFGRPAMAMSDSELWLYYDRKSQCRSSPP
jgi:hypothetical protein